MARQEKILIIGNYADFYPRNYLIIRALKTKFKVKEICLWKEKNKRWWFFYNLFKFGPRYHWILVLKEGQRLALILIFYKLLFFWRSKIIFDAFTSIYDSYVFDRQLTSPRSLKAFYYYLLDFLSCWAADILVFDTLEHKEYFYQTFKVRPTKKFVILPVGVDLDLIGKAKAKSRPAQWQNKFIVLFYGQYIPLQGVEYIIRAAKILSGQQNIHFVLIGSGQESKKIQALFKQYDLANITFLPRLPFVEIIAYIKMADVCLGIFGASDKARRVVPNKVLECAAAGKIVISGRNPAMARYFTDKKSIIFCRLAQADDLAEKIKWAYNNYNSLKHIGPAARQVVEANFSQKRITEIISQEFFANK